MFVAAAAAAQHTETCFDYVPNFFLFICVFEGCFVGEGKRLYVCKRKNEEDYDKILLSGGKKK